MSPVAANAESATSPISQSSRSSLSSSVRDVKSPLSPTDAELAELFADTATPVYRSLHELQDQVEDIEEYRPGGLAPVQLGDMLGDGKYQIVHKLGYGGFATVWLCWEFETDSWKAVKINSARHSVENESPELRAFTRLTTEGATTEELEEHHIQIPTELFWEESPNGSHLCLVQPVLGPKLWRYRKDLGEDTLRARILCRQFAKAMGYLHKMGVYHGDFRPCNILMRLKPDCFDHLNRDRMARWLGRPDIEEVRTLDGNTIRHAPAFVSTSVNCQLFADLSIDEIAVVDFGESYTVDEENKRPGIPVKYAAPEVLFSSITCGFGSDVWSLASTIIEIMLDDGGGERIDTSIRRMERFIGPLPLCYRAEARKGLEQNGWDLSSFPEDIDSKFLPLMDHVKRPVWYTEDSDTTESPFDDALEMFLGSRHVHIKEWAGDFKLHYETISYQLSEEEVYDLADLLRQMLAYKSEERIRLDELLKHRWFQKDYEKAKILERRRDPPDTDSRDVGREESESEANLTRNESCQKTKTTSKGYATIQTIQDATVQRQLVCERCKDFRTAPGTNIIITILTTISLVLIVIQLLLLWDHVHRRRLMVIGKYGRQDGGYSLVHDYELVSVTCIRGAFESN